ncbi:MAG: DUF1896 family protein [Chitinophagaceae bacterium]
MQEILIKKLHEYISQNNPDLFITLTQGGNLTQYLTAKVDAIQDLVEQLKETNTPAYIIEEECMQALTKDLRPSKFNYICAILEEDFETTYQQLQESGTLVYEALNTMNHCKPVFDSLGFTEENEDERQLRYAIIGAISEYLEMNQ